MITYEKYSGSNPEDFGAGRLCEGKDCTQKVMRYTRRQGRNGPLLCSKCVDSFDPVAFKKATLETEGLRPAVVKGVSLPSLKLYRRGAGISQEALDVAVGAYVGFVGKLERKVYRAREEKARALAEELGVSVEDLMAVPEQEDEAA